MPKDCSIPWGWVLLGRMKWISLHNVTNDINKDIMLLHVLLSFVIFTHFTSDNVPVYWNELYECICVAMYVCMYAGNVISPD